MSKDTALSAHDHASKFSHKQRKIALLVLMFAFVMDLLDSTIVNIAIPSIQANLGASYATIQWLVAGYSLAFALLLVTGGRMGDVFGYKKLFMLGVGGFTLASLLSGLAWSPEVLVGTRILQGAMAALMVPQGMSILQIMYKPEERASVNGLFGAMGGIAASLGPIVGGLLIKANIAGLDWRPIFLINVPVGIFGLVMAAKYLPNGKSPHPLKLDIVGTFILVFALGFLAFPLIEGRDLSWPAWTYIMLAASVPALAVFAWWQRRKKALDGSPLIMPELFRKRSFSAGLLVNVIFEAAMLSFFLTFTLMLQAGLGFSPIHAALTGLPISFGIAVCMAALGNTLVPKIGRYSITLGTVVMSIGLAITAYIFQHYQMALHSWQLIPGLLCIGFGMGLVFAPIFAVVLTDVDTKHAGSASGTLNAMQQVGGAIGIALIGVVFFGHLTGGALSSVKAEEPKLHAKLTAQHIPAQAQNQIVAGVEKCFVDRSKQKDTSITPESCKQAESGPADKQLVKDITDSALAANANNFSKAFKAGVLFEAVLLAITFCLSFILPKRIRPEAFAEAA